MSNLIKRFILAGIMIPALFVMIYFLPWAEYLVLNLVIFFFTFWGGMEISRILKGRGFEIGPWTAGTLALIPVLATYLEILIKPGINLMIPAVLLTSSVILAKEGLLSKQNTVSGVIMRITSHLTVLVYPGFFMAYLSRLTSFELAPQIILIFLAIVFSNDSFAYFAGILFGKTNRGIFRVSPNKSLAGLIGGLVAAIAASWLISLRFTTVFNGSLVIAVLTGLIVGTLAVIGDLIESALKRSGEVKDSGTILMGRGGVMDSLDSILFCAPFFFYLMKYLH